MPEIKPEYPEGQHSLEMMLIEMLTEKQSWHDRIRIGNALYDVRKHAKRLKDEQEFLNKTNDVKLTDYKEVGNKISSTVDEIHHPFE
jgi:hypothetical protein